jgi:hypothetical protein
MLTDYKIKRVTRYYSGAVEVVYQVHEGDIATEDEDDGGGRMVSVTRYRRSSLVGGTQTAQWPNITDGEIRRRLNQRLGKDARRTPIPEQINA